MGSGSDATLGATIRRALQDARYTQAQLAKELGTDASQVSRWVNDKAVPHVGTIRSIEAVLGVDLSGAFEKSTADYELYVAAPIAGLVDDDAIASHNESVRKVVEITRQYVNSLYWPASEVRRRADLSASDLITERSWAILARCRAILYLQFDEIVHPSSALVELGLALGRRMNTTIIIDERVARPYLLGGLGRVAERLPFLPEVRTYRVDSVDDACDRIRKNGRELLGLG